MSAAMPTYGRVGVTAGLLALCAAASAITAGPALATPTYLHVGGSGCSDNGRGTSGRPFCTIDKGASVATSGQSVLVASGTYAEKVTVRNSGVGGRPIVIRPRRGATVAITGGSNGFVLSGVQHVQIDGFTITNPTSYGISVSNSSDIVLSNNTITYAGTPASGQIAAGIRLVNTTASTVTGNITDHNSDHGIYIGTGSTGNTVSYNEASWNANEYRRNANGINVIGAGNTVIGNIVHDNEDSGLQFFTGGNDNLATLNVSYNNGDHGIDNLNVTGGRLIGNTIYHNCTSGINVEGTSGNYVVKNNIAVDNAVYPAYNGISCNRRAGNIGIWDSAPPTTVVNRNLVWLTTSGTMYVFGSSYTSLAAMRTATGQEQQGIQADPRFFNAAGGDLRLTAGSPAVDSADSAAPGAQAQDILGIARVDDPTVANTGAGPRTYDDRGAYELASGGPAAPTATLIVSPSTGTAPLTVTADASGSTDPQGGALTYTFDFGDGTTVGPQAAPTATHTYSGSYTATVTVTNPANVAAYASRVVTVLPAGRYIAQIATNFATATRTSGSVTVWRPQGVQPGNLIVATLQLTGTSATGTVSGTDDAGDALAVAADIADGAGNRLIVLYAVAATGLATDDKINVVFPSATSYRLTADEVAGVSTPDKLATASGSTAAYSSSATGTTTAANEYVHGAVGLFGGSAPTWSAGWTPMASYATGSSYLGRAYQTAASTGSFNASGTGSGAWLAVCVTFR
jgi:parallel beta-helix repeat protein